MITKCMLRVGSSMTSNEANLTSGGACSEFSDSSSSVSTDELPPTFGSSNRAGSISSGGGLLALVTTAPATTTNGFGSRSRLLHIGGGVSSTSGDSGNLFSNDTTMISLMEASDCDDFTGKWMMNNGPNLGIKYSLKKCNGCSSKLGNYEASTHFESQWAPLKLLLFGSQSLRKSLHYFTFSFLNTTILTTHIVVWPLLL